MAERGAEDDRVLPFATQTAAADGAAAMSIDVGRRLGLDHGVLEPAEQILGVLQTQANGLTTGPERSPGSATRCV